MSLHCKTARLNSYEEAFKRSIKASRERLKRERLKKGFIVDLKSLAPQPKRTRQMTEPISHGNYSTVEPLKQGVSYE